MNDTPLTDALISRHTAESNAIAHEERPGHELRQIKELIAHTRTLERELAARRNLLADATAERDTAQKALRLACQKIEDLTPYPREDDRCDGADCWQAHLTAQATGKDVTPQTPSRIAVCEFQQMVFTDDDHCSHISHVIQPGMSHYCEHDDGTQAQCQHFKPSRYAQATAQAATND